MPKIVYDIEFKVKSGNAISDALASTSSQTQRVKQQVYDIGEGWEIATGAVRQFDFGVKKAVQQSSKSLSAFRDQLRNTANQTRVSTKALSTANQALFSLSDGFQDAAQFSQGFAQGMRAIGNNVSFTAELFTQLGVTAKRDGITRMEALKQSFLGAGGALLALNIAFSASQIIMTAFGKAGKEATKNLDDLISTFKELRDSDAFDFLNIRDLETQIEFLERQSEALDRLTALVDARVIKRLEEEFGLTREQAFKLKEQLRDSRKELEELIARTKLDPLAVFRSDLEFITENLLSDFETGLNRSTDVLSAQAGEIQQTIIDLQRGDTSFLKALGISPEDTKVAIQILQQELKRLQDFVPEKPIIEAIAPEDVVIDNMDEIIETIGLDPLGLEAQLDITDFGDVDAFSNQLFDDIVEQDEKERQKRLVEINRVALKTKMDEISAAQNDFKRLMNEQEQLETDTANARIEIQRSMQSTFFSLAQTFAKDSKGLAIAFLAVEKGLKIAQVITDTIEKAAAATKQGLLYAANPATAFLAPTAFAAAAAIKASGALAVANIAAQGIAQGSNMSNSGGSSSSGGGAGGSAGGASASGRAGSPSGGSSFGITRSGEGSPTFLPSNGTLNQQPTFIIDQKVTNKGLALSVRRGNNEIRSNRVEVSG